MLRVPDAPQACAFAGALAEARDEYAVNLRRGHHGGRELLHTYSDRIDVLVRQIAADVDCSATAPYALAALGGYGRRTLCLHSDVDLLIVCDGRIRAPEERLVKALLHPLWDLRLTIGHQVRELADLEFFDEDNPEFLLALVDARFLAGDAAVFERVRECTHRAGRDQRRRVLDILRSLVMRRHRSFNETLYQLEPDIKDAPGGLRDAVAAQWFRDLAGDEWAGNERIDVGRWHEAEDFLLRVRSILHLESGRNSNVLTHPMQERVATLLHYEGGTERRVEGLMGDYFRHARCLARTLEWSRQAAGARDGTPGGSQGPAGALPLGANIELADEGIRFADPVRAAADPTSWVLAFRMAADHGCRVSDQALTWIHENASRSRPEDFVATASDRRMLLQLFQPASGLYERMAEMRDCGLLGRIFPEFQKIHCRVIRDFHHKYTVDEHTLLTLRNLESLLEPATASRERFASLLRELHAPDLLSLALLFHDVGKWKDQEHTSESVRLAQPTLDRLRLTPEARHTVEFLIGQHLQMSRVAFRRDCEDPDVARAFAAIVGTEERLKMLCLMTLADIEAVSPEALTPWKEELLWSLYVESYNCLTMSYADDLIEADPAAVVTLSAPRPADITADELSQFLRGLPRRYLAVFDAERIYRHVRLARDIHRDQVHSFLETKDDIWELTVVTLDKPFLFASISGVLSHFGMDILRAQALTTPHGLVLDVFQFSDAQGFLERNRDAVGEIARLLEEVVAGRADLARLLRAREHSVLYRRRTVVPVVHFDHEHSKKYTVLEIVADDGPGLLHRISRVISSEGCDVDLALISTEGHKAIDVLHVTREKHKLSESECTALKGALEHALLIDRG